MTTELQQQMLTDRQEVLLNWIRDYMLRHSYSPSIEDIADGLGKGESVILQRLKILERKGWIRRTPRVPRSIVLLPEGL